MKGEMYSLNSTNGCKRNRTFILRLTVACSSVELCTRKISSEPFRKLNSGSKLGNEKVFLRLFISHLLGFHPVSTLQHQGLNFSLYFLYFYSFCAFCTIFVLFKVLNYIFIVCFVRQCVLNNIFSNKFLDENNFIQDQNISLYFSH